MNSIKLAMISVFVLVAATTRGQLNPSNVFPVPEMEVKEIFDVLPDKQGNIWVASINGLLRFDGYDVTRYHPDPIDSTTINELLTYRLFEDSNGKIWIGGHDLISQYNPQTKIFTSFRYLHLTDYPEGSRPGVWSIAEGSQGRVFFGITSGNNINAGHSVVYFDPTESVMKRLEYDGSVELSYVYYLSADTAGEVLVSARSGGYIIDKNLNVRRDTVTERIIGSDQTEDVIRNADSRGFVWVVNKGNSLWRVNPKSGEFQRWSMANLFPKQSQPNYTYKLIEDADGNIWMGTQLGPVLFNTKRMVFEVFDYQSTKKIHAGGVIGLRFDAFGDLWFGITSYGLIRYSNKSNLKAFVGGTGYPKTFEKGWVSKIIEAGDGTILISTIDNGKNNSINVVNLKDDTVFRLFDNNLIAGRLVGKLPSGQLLLEDSNKFFSLDLKKNRINPFTLPREVINAKYLTTIVYDDEGNTYFCTDDGLFIQSSNDSSIRRINLQNFPGSNVLSNEVTGVWNSKKYGLWILTNNGLFLIDSKTGELIRFGFDSSKGDVFKSQDVNSLYETDNGTVWVGTWQGGLSQLLPEEHTITTYTMEDGLPSSSIQGVIGDEKNETLWLGTFDGLSRFDIRNRTFTNYSTSDGIHGLLFTDGVILKTTDGYFLFGGNNGVSYFNPDHFSAPSVPPMVYLLSLKIGDQRIDLTTQKNVETVGNNPNNLQLNYDQNSFSVFYTGIHFDNPRKNKFAYQLENYDDTWRVVDNIRTAFYYNVPPGKYTFRVKAANSNGVWSDESTSIDFEIASPWWQTWWAFCIYGFLFLAGLLTVHNVQKERTIRIQREQAQIRELAQAKEIEQAYTQLKATQAQLIQSEKMASLGELTAGIAHEIQNPLNFVNNFSELSNELMEEMQEELDKGDVEEAKALSTDIRANLEKISHHGKRASGIVKGMLEHSRTRSGEKSVTDINSLADEYLRLSFHGLRAKDKSFNADFSMDLDPDLPKINLVAPDIGRVILNLINNAFYAVHEKSKAGIDGYKPEVKVQTKLKTDHVEISVSDNGNGIPDEIRDKIFQPFFTTKPTGEGTGLGLSLSYDIVKAHGATLRMHSVAGVGSVFTIEFLNKSFAK